MKTLLARGIFRNAHGPSLLLLLDSSTVTSIHPTERPRRVSYLHSPVGTRCQLRAYSRPLLYHLSPYLRLATRRACGIRVPDTFFTAVAAPPTPAAPASARLNLTHEEYLRRTRQHVAHWRRRRSCQEECLAWHAEAEAGDGWLHTYTLFTLRQSENRQARQHDLVH